jgi:hypothetical protein
MSDYSDSFDGFFQFTIARNAPFRQAHILHFAFLTQHSAFCILHCRGTGNCASQPVSNHSAKGPQKPLQFPNNLPNSKPANDLATTNRRPARPPAPASPAPILPPCLFLTTSPNPEGIESSSPGLARFREGQPWVIARKCHNPNGVEYQIPMNQMQLFQSCDSSVISPRVARSSQPWAERGNPVGIGRTNDKSPCVDNGSAENAEKPKLVGSQLPFAGAVEYAVA